MELLNGWNRNQIKPDYLAKEDMIFNDNEEDAETNKRVLVNLSIFSQGIHGFSQEKYYLVKV